MMKIRFWEKQAMKPIAVLAVVLGACALNGCAYLNVGEEDFSCSGMPDSVFCRSARDVYEATNDGAVPSRIGPEGAYNKECDDCIRSEGRNFNFGYEAEDAGQRLLSAADAGTDTPRRARDGGQGDEVIDSFVTPRLPDKPVPIRTPAVVMRIWIAPWVDAHDDLIAPGYVYAEIEPRRWIYSAAANAAHSSKFEPLRNTKRSVSGANGSRTSGENTLEKLKEAQRANLK